MHASAAFVLAIASFAAAQSTPVAVSGCGNAIDLIIQSCLGSTTPQLTACATNDWDCMCTQATNVLTCYNNCPSDPNRFGADSTRTSYCDAAAAYGSSASSAMQTATGTGATTMMPSNTATPTESSSSGSEPSSTMSGSGSAASATHSGAANALAVPAGLAAVFGLAALL